MLCYQQSVSQWSSFPHHPQSIFNVALSLLTFSILYVIVSFLLLLLVG